MYGQANEKGTSAFLFVVFGTQGGGGGGGGGGTKARPNKT